MKKLIFPAFCLTLALTSVNVSAANTTSHVITVNANDDERKAVKPEELPAPVTKAVTGDAYKGWVVKEAALVNPSPAAGAAATEAKPEAYYEVTLTHEKETKTVKFHKDGTEVK